MQVYILNKSKENWENKTNKQGKHFKIIENAKGKKRIRRKGENIECFINFNKRKKMFTKKIKSPESFELGIETIKVM